MSEQYNRIILVEFISVFLAIFGITFAIVLNELSYFQEINEQSEEIVLSYIAFSSVSLALAIFIRYDLYLKWYVKRGLLTQYDTLISTGWWREMVLEQFFVLIAPYPFLQGVKYTEVSSNWNVTIQYEINQILMCVSFSRIYIILRYVLFISKFMNPRSVRVCVINGCSADHMFAIKGLVK